MSERIAIVGIKRLPGVAGADRMVEQVVAHLPEENRYTIYLERGGAPGGAFVRNVEYVEIPALQGKHAHAASFFLLCSVHIVARASRYDVVHVHNSDFGVFCLPIKLRRRLRIVGTFHGDPYRRKKWGPVARAFLRLSEVCFVFACDALTSVARGKSARGRPVEFIPNGIETWSSVPSRRSAALDKLGNPVEGFVLFACGRLDRTKGLHHLLRALPMVPGDFTVIAVGDFTQDPGYSEEIDRAARRDPRVVLHKRLLPRSELLEAMAAARAFVFPSETEGMSMILLEAISCGGIVVCSDIAENLEVVGESYGLRFHSGQPASLAAALTRALDATDSCRLADESRASGGRLLPRATHGYTPGNKRSGLSRLAADPPSRTSGEPDERLRSKRPRRVHGTTVGLGRCCSFG
jgi:glycosyltransferase involved in cell wall biosynthesis